MNARKFFATAWWLVFLVALPVDAQDAKLSQPAETPPAATAAREQADDPSAVTRHTISIDGEKTNMKGTRILPSHFSGLPWSFGRIA